MYALVDGTLLKEKPSLHTNYILQILFTDDGKHMITSSKDKKIKIWDLVTNDLVSTLYGHTGDVESIFLSPNQKYLFSGSSDCTIRVWDMSNNEQICELNDDFRIKTLWISSDS